MNDVAFLDFHLIVNKIADDDSDNYVTVVGEAPVSRWGYRFDRVARGESLEKVLQRLAAADLIRDPQGSFRLQWSRPAETTEVRDARPSGPSVSIGRELTEIGRSLFWLLFPERSDAYQIFGRSCECANRDGKYLRLKLELHPELSNLPWELMQWPITGAWAEEINRTRISLVRFLGNIETWRPTAAARPCVVVAKANPRDLLNARVTQSFYSERKRLEEILRRQGDVDCEIIEEPATIRILGERITQLERAGRPVIGFHFIGHGGVDDNGGFLFWEDGDLQNGERIYEADLRMALDGAKSLRWVIFNACSTGHQPLGCPLAGLATSLSVLKNVPTVIAYQRPVETDEAEQLAAEFYKLVLEDGLAIEDVVRDIQLRYRNPGGLVVLMRSIKGEVQSRLRFGAGQPVAQPDPDPSVRATAQHGPRRGPAMHTRAAVPEDLGEMVLIPAGPFQKGLTPAQVESLIEEFREHGLSLDFDSAREVLKAERQEIVTLPDFSIDLTPVTNAQLRRFVEATGHVTEAEESGAPQNWRLNDQPDKADHPAVFVSYNDAQAYCRWAGKRLPTADEWKKAYRGPEGRVYPWGDEFDIDLCNTAESQRGWQTTPVKRFPNGRSFYGCYDMVGNVEEWTATPGGHQRSSRVVLGGSWCMTCQVYGLPVLQRFAAPSFYSNEQGFRCAKDVK